MHLGASQYIGNALKRQTMLPQVEGFIRHFCGFAHVRHHKIWTQLIGLLRLRQQNPSGLKLLAGGLDPAVKAITSLNPCGEQFRMGRNLLVEILAKGLTICHQRGVVEVICKGQTNRFIPCCSTLAALLGYPVDLLSSLPPFYSTQNEVELDLIFKS